MTTFTSNSSAAAVEATNTDGGDGVFAVATTGNGIHASQGNGSGISGARLPSGVWGDAESGNGVLGFSKSGPGVAGRSATGPAGFFDGNVTVTENFNAAGGFVSGRVIWGKDMVNINGADGGIFASGNATIDGTLTVGGIAITGTQLKALLALL